MSLVGTKLSRFRGENVEGHPRVSHHMASFAEDDWLIVGFASRETRLDADRMLLDVSGAILDSIAVAHVVALPGVPKMVRKLPTIAIRTEFGTLVENIGKRLAARGVSMGPAAIRERIALFLDWEGDLIPSNPLKGKVDEVSLLVLDGSGTVKHHETGWDDDKRDRTVAMLREITQTA